MKVVGIEKEALSRCDRLSGGQKQRAKKRYHQTLTCDFVMATVNVNSP